MSAHALDRQNFRYLLSAGIIGALVLAAILLARKGVGGDAFPLSLLLGGAFGFLLQRGRFCFFCVTRDWLERREAAGLFGILAALAVGLIGHTLVVSGWVPDALSGRLPPDGHIGPISWVLALGAFIFGVGMAISGSCLSAHFYRLGEGNLSSILAILGAAIGFVLGFLAWNTLYLRAVQEAPVIWLPNFLGHGGALALQLAVLALGAVLLWRFRRDGEGAGTGTGGIFRSRWPGVLAGSLIGMLATLAYLRVAPLGVTAELGSIARTGADGFAILPARLEGLDTLRGCATAIKETILSRNGLFVLGLIAGSFAAAIPAGDLKWRLPDGWEVLRAISGGILLGFGAMIALGCTVGVLLSGVMIGALSGWVFALFGFLGIWIGLILRRNLARISAVG